MIWHIIKYWVSFIIPTFYKRIQGRNIKNLQVKGPVIMAMNHPNAFTDPIVITNVSYPLRLKYLARGDAFKPGLIAWLLERIGIVPIFRMQDGGKEGLKKNDEAYRRVNYLLKRNAKIMVFAEGLCIQERRLRPLKKGSARMVFGAWEAINNPDLRVVPVGINYSQADKFRSTVFYNVGEPIMVKDFIAEYNENPAKAYNTFLQMLAPAMKGLITHIDKPENDEVVYQAETLLKRKLLKEQGLDYTNLEHDFNVLTQITEKINAAAMTNQPALDEFKPKARAYFNDLKKNGLRDWLFDPARNRQVSSFYLALRYILLILGFPLYALGMAGNYLPLKLSAKTASKIVKHKEFYSSFFIAMAMVFFLLNYLLWFFIPYAFSPNVLWPIVICLAIGLCGWFSLYYHPFLYKTLGMTRVLKNKALAKEFSKRRGELLSLINKF